MTLTDSLTNSATNKRHNVHSQKGRKWTSNEVVHSLPPKDRLSIFIGSVRIDPLFQANDPARAVGASVTFEPGSRTAWHTHPLGQILIVTAGCSVVQRWGGSVDEIRPGDVVRIPPNEKHWHGATATTSYDPYRHSGTD